MMSNKVDAPVGARLSGMQVFMRVRRAVNATVLRIAAGFAGKGRFIARGIALSVLLLGVVPFATNAVVGGNYGSVWCLLAALSAPVVGTLITLWAAWHAEPVKGRR